MIAPNIDIPPGLESAYYAVVRAMSGLNADAIGVQAYVAQKRSYKGFAQQSYFVLFNGVYDALSDARKIAWTSYWLTLPFGTHAGANGYPGSGFSAFIYVNAPRYKSGLDFLLDPPTTTNLWPNGDFHLGATGWNINSAFDISSGKLNCVSGQGGGDALITDTSYDADLVVGHTYRFEFDFSISAGVVDYYFYNHENAEFLTSGTLAHTTGHISFDFTLGAFDREDGWTPFIEIDNNAVGWLSNFSLIEL